MLGLTEKNSLLITVDLEDWYHVGDNSGRPTSRFKTNEEIKAKYRGEGLYDPVFRILDLFEDFKVKATFFELDEIVKEYPDLIEIIVCGGHEVASHDMYHISPTMRSASVVKKDIEESARLIEQTIDKALLRL